MISAFRSFISPEQRTVAMVTEMIHTATLIHDDVIDNAWIRRGKDSVNKKWGERKVHKYFMYLKYF